MKPFELTPPKKQRTVKTISKKPWRQPEQEAQKALVDWLHKYCRLPGADLVYCVPNQVPLYGPMKYGIVNWLKAMGLLNGVSDLVVPPAHRGWFGAYMETKQVGYTDSDFSDEEKWFGKRIEEEGYLYKPWCRFEEGKEFLTWYLTGPRTVIVSHLLHDEEIR